MTRSELWAIYTARNPSFAKEDGNVTMSAKGLRKLFDQTWDEATREANEQPDQSAGAGLFNQLFGNKKL